VRRQPSITSYRRAVAEALDEASSVAATSVSSCGAEIGSEYLLAMISPCSVTRIRRDAPRVARGSPRSRPAPRPTVPSAVKQAQLDAVPRNASTSAAPRGTAPSYRTPPSLLSDGDITLVAAAAVEPTAMKGSANTAADRRRALEIDRLEQRDDVDGKRRRSIDLLQQDRDLEQIGNRGALEIT
jgi:hypothetical protein